ncbi:putative acetyltransferase OgpAT, partial [Madurella mycetomatis]
CRVTLPPSIARSPTAVKIAPYLWTLPFTHLCARNCFVLDDGAGNAVGYVIGAPDVFALAAEYPRYVGEVLGSETGRADVPVPTQLSRREEWRTTSSGADGEVNGACLAQLAYKVEWLVLEGVEGKKELVEGWRAMMHIDLLEEWQGQGWGRKMIERFVEGVKGSGCEYGKGIQIGVSGENTKVLGFYEKCGFRVYHGGEREGNVWMVKDL